MGFTCKVAQECLEGHKWDTLGCDTEGTKGCSALGVSGFHVGSLYGAVCPCRKSFLVGPRLGHWHVNFAKTHSGFLVVQLNHDWRLGSKCKIGLGQENMSVVLVSPDCGEPLVDRSCFQQLPLDMGQCEQCWMPPSRG